MVEWQNESGFGAEPLRVTATYDEAKKHLDNFIRDYAINNREEPEVEEFIESHWLNVEKDYWEYESPVSNSIERYYICETEF